MVGRILDVCTRIGKSADPQLTVKESQGLREMTAAGDVRVDQQTIPERRC